MSSSAYAQARELIDACHRKDPAYLARSTHSEDASTSAATKHQDELSYADGCEAWAIKLLESDPTSSSHLEAASPGGLELVKLAARCQHLERFLVPRSSFPDGKMGYFKWRKSLYKIQADRAAELLAQAGVSSEEQELVRKWVSKTDLQPGKDGQGDPGTQLLEDAAVMVFLEDQLKDFAEQHQDYTKEKYMTILAKTWRKLSPNAKKAAGTIPLEPGLKALVGEATGELDRQQAEEVAAGQDNQESHMSPTLEDLSLSPPVAAPQLQADTTSQALPAAQRTGRPKSKEEAEALLLRHSLQDPAGAQSGTTTAKNNPLFGSRLLREGDDPMSHNAWDHVEPPPEYQAMVDSLLATQAETKVPTEKADELYHAQPASHWDAFYAQHENRFFKRRAWLGNEFPELMALLEREQSDNVNGTSSSKSKGVFEIGCGNGSSVFPLLEQNANPDLTVYACDYSKEAIQVVRSNELYQNPPIGKARAFVWDVSSQAGPPVDEIQEGSLDVIVLIFVLSALHLREWKQAVSNIHRLLKPDGLLLFRDYARYDLPQLRFRKGRMLDDNFYARGDGTRVYFFTPEELVEIFQTGPPPDTSTGVDDENASTEPQWKSDLLFDTLQLATDRRMLVNRKENKQMYRCWLQGKFRKR